MSAADKPTGWGAIGLSPASMLGVVLPWLSCWAATFGCLLLAGGNSTHPLATGWLAWAPLAVSLLVFGLPHGAVDHLEIARLSGRPWLSVPVLGALVGYLAVAVGIVAFWWAAPAAAFVGFIALTWLHWGQGDVWFLRRRAADVAWPRGDRLSLAALHGALPMLGPLAWDPPAFRRIFEATTGLFSRVDTSARLWQTLSEAAFLALLALIVVHAALRMRTGWRKTSWFEAVDLLTLLALFRTVPAIFAVGLYFCVWHSTRHVVRLASDRSEGRTIPWSAVDRTLRQSVPLTLVSLAVGVGFGFWLTSGASGAYEAWFAWYLVALSGLTVPHVAVVLWMDHADGVWAADKPA